MFECDAVAFLLVGLGGDEPYGFVVLQLFECGLVLLVDLCQAPILVSLFLLVGVLVQLVLPLLSLVGVAFIEIALALQCFLVVLCHGGVVLFGGDEPLRELHFELVVLLALQFVDLFDVLFAVLQLLFLELVFLGFLLVAGLSTCVGGGSCAFSLCVTDGLGGFLVDEFAVKVLDLVVPLDKVVELIDFPCGFCQIGLRGVEGDSVFRAFCELLRTQSISFVYDYSGISGCLLLPRCILRLFQFTVNGSDVVLLSVDCHLLLNSCLLQFHQLIVGGFSQGFVLQRANVVRNSSCVSLGQFSLLGQ